MWTTIMGVVIMVGGLFMLGLVITIVFAIVKHDERLEEYEDAGYSEPPEER